MLIDSFGRVIDYLRVSVTDRCNLRCVYCMPEGGVEWKPHDSMLSFEEILRLCRIMAGLGIKKIKLTGGEPLVRRGFASFLKNLRGIPGIEKVTLTTNGLLLGAYLDEAEKLLPGSLPDGVNISLDALDSARHARITRLPEPRPADVLRHVDRLIAMKVAVKINCVPVSGFNEEEIVPIAALARDKNISVRFIELMPLGAAADLKPVSGGETAALLEEAYGKLTLLPDVHGNGPAVYYSLPGFTGTIGFINPVSHGFCETCNRLRLSSEGRLKPCLSADLALDLKTLLRSGAPDADLIKEINAAVAQKPQFHTFSQIYGAEEEEHPDGMSVIGG